MSVHNYLHPRLVADLLTDKIDHLSPYFLIHFYVKFKQVQAG